MKGSRIRLIVALVCVLVGFFWIRDAMRTGGRSVDTTIEPPAQSASTASTPAPIDVTPQPESRVEVASPNAQAGRAKITFVDDQGALLPFAQFAVVENGIENAVGTADDHALLSLAPALVAGRDCLARAEKHRPALVHMPARFETTTIVLERFASISGSVRLPDGSRPDSIFCVVASPGKSRPSCAEVARPAESDTLRWAKTDANGFFRIEGLDRNRSYTLSGAGQGFIVERLEGIHPGAVPADLIARPLYGVRIVVVDEQDRPIRSSPKLFSSSSFNAGVNESSVKPVDLVNELVLAGVAGVDCIDREDQDSILLLYSTDSERPYVGPVVFSIERPGYQRQTRSALATRVRDSVGEKVIRMAPDGRASGALEVHVALAAGEIGADITLRLIGSQSNSTYYLDLSGPSATPQIISGVPSDDYTYDVLVCDKMAIVSRSESGAELRVRVLPDQTSVLNIDLSKQRIVNVVVTGELGLTYSGPLIVRVIALPSRRVRHIDFASAPYRLIGVSEGEYSISAMPGRAGSTAVGQEEFQTRTIVGPDAFQEVLLTSKFGVPAELR